MKTLIEGTKLTNSERMEMKEIAEKIGCTIKDEGAFRKHLRLYADWKIMAIVYAITRNNTFNSDGSIRTQRTNSSNNMQRKHNIRTVHASTKQSSINE